MTNETEVEEELINFSPHEAIQIIHKKTQIELLKQLIDLYSLSQDWFDIILKLAWKAVDLVKPDVKHDNDHMDIRTYLKIKKLPGN